MTEKEPQRPKDIDKITRYLSNTFNQVTSGLERPTRTVGKGGAGVANAAYILHRDFAYLLHEVVVGPRSVLQLNITACNEFIDDTMQTLQRR